MNMANASYNWEALLMLDFLFEANLWHSPTSATMAQAAIMVRQFCVDMPWCSMARP